MGSAPGPELDPGTSTLIDRAAPGGHRSDIQGLRAVAVAAVVAYHLLGWPSGGFVGVDVFFVISGFLMTGLLLRELDSRGRISWSNFYRRRARRILPAALACLIVVVAASWVVHRPARSADISVDAIFSAMFVANWHFAALGTDYLSSAEPVSPLEHFWSLAVEEQFYLLWPLLVIAIVAVSVHTRVTSARTLIAAVLAIAVAGSFTWSVLEAATSPAWAYFSTLSRAWEIAAGALLALLAGGLTQLSNALRTTLLFAGLALIGGALFVIDQATAFPGPWSAVPVMGALLVLAGGIGGPPRHCWMLTNPCVQYVGRISYSLYLWHFPVIVLAAALLPAGPMSVMLTVTVMVVLSMASFNLIEKPWRRSECWPGPLVRQPRIPVGWTAVVVIIVALSGIVPRVSTSTGTDPSLPFGLDASSPEAQLQADIGEAVRAASWPELTPAIDGLADVGRPPRDRECATGLADPVHPVAVTPSTASVRPVISAGDTADCAFGDPGLPRLAVVAGDSMAISWLPLVQELFEPQGYRVQGLTMSGCPFVAIETRNPAANVDAACPRHKTSVVLAIRALQPDVVIISNTFDPWLRDDSDGDGAAVRYADGQGSVVGGLGVAAAVYVLAPPPPGLALEDCGTRVSIPADCVSGIPDRWRRFNDAMATRLAATPRTTYVDTSLWFCTAAGLCPGFVGTTPTRRDAAGHVVPGYAQRLAPLLSAVVLPGR